MTTTIPCKRPHVTIEAHTKTFDTGATATYHLVTCSVPGCTFTYDAAVVTDAAQQATWHRQAHRAAVPAVITKTIDTGRLVDQCQHCGWVTPVGFTTIDDRKRKLDEHLVDHHGLVSC